MSTATIEIEPTLTPTEPVRWEYVEDVLITSEYLFDRNQNFRDMDCPAGCDYVVGVCTSNGIIIGMEVDCECEFTREHFAKMETQIDREREEYLEAVNHPASR